MAVLPVEVVLDREQEPAVERLELLLQELPRRRSPRGVYLCGPVGRGKTMLLDAALSRSPVPSVRLHLHAFLAELHRAVARRRARGSTGPDDAGAAVDELLGAARLVCLDELHVHDPGDAALLAVLLRMLRLRGRVLLATSNYAPEGLLPDPLHHHLVLPAVRLLHQLVDVVHVDGPTDHRTTAADRPRTGFASGSWLCPGTPDQLRRHGLEPVHPSERTLVQVAGRELAVRAARDDELWIDARTLCTTPTAVQDYLQLAARWGTWVVTGLPALADLPADPQQRFANVVDVLCDAGTRLVVTSEHAPDRALAGATGPRDLPRTASRVSLLRYTAR